MGRASPLPTDLIEFDRNRAQEESVQVSYLQDLEGEEPRNNIETACPVPTEVLG
jgi:hypothetical protein